MPLSSVVYFPTMKTLGRFARILPYYRPYALILAVDLLSVVAIAASSLAVPYLLKYMVDVLVPAADFRMLRTLTLAAAAADGVKYAATYYTLFAGHVMAAKMERDLRRDFFRKLQRMSFSFFDARKTGELMSRLTNDIGKVTDAVNHAPEDILLSILMVVFSAILLFSLNPLLAVFCFVPLALMIVYSGLLGGRIRAGFERVNDAVADINAKTENIVAGIRVVQAFARESEEEKRFDELNEKHYLSWRTVLNRLGWFYSGVDLMKDLSRLIVLVVGGYLVLRGSMTLGTLVAFLSFVAVYMEPVERLSRTVEMVQRMNAGLKNFFDIMDEPEAIRDAEDALSLPPVRGRIGFDRVSFSYDGNRHVFRGLSLVVEPGRTVALVGPSGAGKSTFASLIPRFYEASEGVVSLDGIDVRRLRLAELRGAIGLVQQDVFLFAGTVRENLSYGKPDASDAELRTAAARANAKDFIEALPTGYETWIGERGVRLSGGQKQRLSIARAFLKDPPVLILDEATSSLDAESEAAVQDALKRLMGGRTTIVIAHRLSTVREADEIVVLTEDGIAERGTHAELLSGGGLYARYYAGRKSDLLGDEEAANGDTGVE